MARSSTTMKPGETLNPNGRPKKEYSITQTIKDMMNVQPDIKKALGTKIIECALKGDMTAIKLIWGYVDGMPVQKNVLSGDEDSPVKIDIGSTLKKVYGGGRIKTVGEVSDDS